MMQDEKTLRDEVRRAWPENGVPSFDATLGSAERRYAASRRQYRWFAGAAAAAAAVVVAFNLQAPEKASYIEVAELLETTYWSAPSDVLLPEHEFDIYQELPVIFESTEPAEGALL